MGSLTDAIEKKFNPKMLSIIFNYISASHNGVTEMELVDLLSCNNEFFTEFYTDSSLPSVLRFPTALWIILKFHLGWLIGRTKFGTFGIFFFCYFKATF